MENLSRHQLLELIVHQLKSPLGICAWHTEMLLDSDYGKLTPEQTTIVQEIHDMQRQITASLQTIFCIFGSAAVPIPAPHTLSDIGDHLLDSSHAERARYPHAVTGTLLTSNEVFVCDNLLLTLSLQTLLTNALQYAPASATITLDVTKTPDKYIFSVQHEGKPFSEEEKEKLFLPYFRGEDAKKNVPGGTGIGLSLVKSLVESTGGNIWCESSIESGIAFFISYPVSGMTNLSDPQTL